MYTHSTHPLPPLPGPPGSCKSTAVRVLAKEVGFEVQEWSAPTPTLWSEHVYQVEGGGGGEG